METGALGLIDGSAELASRLGAYPLGPGDIARAGPALLLARAFRLNAVSGFSIPVLVIDAPDEPIARAALLDAGAADVVSPGTDPIEIVARARAILRRRPPIRCGDLVIDPGERQAERAGRPLALHPREFALLSHLVRHRDQTVTRAALYAAVWQRSFDPGSNVVAVAVSRLRAKLEARGTSPLIHTMPGGYMLSAVATP